MKNVIYLFYVDAASNLMKQSKDVDTTANKVYTDNKPAITKLDADDVEARDLMARGLKLRNDSDDLYQKAKDANEQAKKAQEEGKRVAKEAKEMLETLEVSHIVLLFIPHYMDTELSLFVCHMNSKKRMYDPSITTWITRITTAYYKNQFLLGL